MRGLGKLGLFFLLFSVILTSIATLPEFSGVDHPGFANNKVDVVEERAEDFEEQAKEDQDTSLLEKVTGILGGSEVFNLAFTVVSTFSWAFGLISSLVGTATQVIGFVLIMPENGPTFGTVVRVGLLFTVVIGFIRVITGREF